MIKAARRRMRRFVAALMPLLGTSCGIVGGDCTSIGKAAVAVRIRDARTSAGIAEGARLWIEGNGLRDSTTVPVGRNLNDTEVPLLRGATGTFSLTVHKEGYVDWERHNIAVSRARCGQPETVYIEARLSPAT